jgi:hypothetical protein
MAINASDLPKPQMSLLSHPLAVIYLTASLVMLPALLLGAMANGTDSIFHARWIQYFSEQFWSGEIYPRWLMGLNDGFGSPVFFIYPPFSQYITALLHPLFPNPQLAAVSLGVSVWLAMALSGIACFHWLRRAVPDREAAAIVGATAYMLAPYHLYIDVYQRGAIAEVWAFVWPPLTLLLLHGSDRVSPARLALLSITIAGLLITHAPSSLILVPAYFLYALLLDWQERRAVRCVTLLVACVLACLLAGWYLGPALMHRQHINTAALFGGRNLSTNWLIGGGAWPDPVIQRAIYIAVGLQFGLSLIAGAVALAKAGRGERVLPIAALLFSVIPLVMMTVISRPLWELGLPINQVQFPWRFTLLLSLGGALAVAASHARLAVLTARLAVIPLLLLAGNGVIHWFPASYDFPHSAEPAPVNVDESRWDAPEYQLAPRHAVEGIFAAENARILRGGGYLRVTEWRPRSLSFDVDLKQASTIAIRQFDYPGWEASSAPENSLQATFVKDKPYLQLLAPAGQYTIHLTLAETIAERAGRLASTIGAVFVCGLLLWGWRRSRRVAA